MKEKNYENSVEASIPIKKIMDAAQELDIEYLESALKDMWDNHHRRDSMAVLNPNPFTHNEKQELNAAKLRQLELMIELGKNVQSIKEKTLNLYQAEQNSSDLGKLFGL